MLTWSNVWLYLRPLVKMAVILLLGYIIIKYAMKLISRAFSKTKLDPSLVKYSLKAIKAVFYVFLALSAFDAVGVSTGGVIAAMSAVALAVGVALKDSLSNVAGGVWLLFSPRFATGDYIAVGGDEGTVISVELFHTTLQTPDSRRISIPNGLMVNSHIINYSAENKRRVDILLPISYGSDVKTAKKLALDTVSNHSLVLNGEGNEPFVRVKDYGDSSVNLAIRGWCKTEDYWTVFFDLTEDIRDAFNKNEISIPYNQLDVHIKNDVPTKR